MKQDLEEHGFVVVKDVFQAKQVDNILKIIGRVDISNPVFRKSKELFAIRQFFKQIPEVVDAVMQPGLKHIIHEIAGSDYFIVKSIYFDKPSTSNWFVSWHQDLTISVDKKINVTGFGPWTVKEGQFAVQPPLAILEDNFTIRVHLDDTTKENGALKVIPQSHLKAIYRAETIDWQKEREIDCEVPMGGIMIMKPLLLHSSGRTTNNESRRVIHIEFSRSELPVGLQWAELVPRQLAGEI
ncbi:phytanoyl-CoA dioxygenase family protein [Flavitalea sp.]|nr:phytanoyl-CoA dioxygenase family protein [Flavitalea sp.]